MPLRMLVVGEVILDRYISGDVDRISPEAPIPVLRVRRRESRLGNAGFVMANLAAMGAHPSALSVIGADHNGETLRELLRGAGVDTQSLLIDPDRPTIVKERMLGSVQSANRATQQLLRVDEEEIHPLGADRERELIERMESELDRADGVLVSDINKGLLTPTLLLALIDGARRRSKPIVVDPRRVNDFSIYRGASAITPNRYETEQATGILLRDASSCHAAAQLLIEQLDLYACLITLDRDGMYLSLRGGVGQHILTKPREVHDVTGAGDVVLALFGLLMTAKADLHVAATVANVAAGIEVSRLGAEVISREELNRELMTPAIPSRRKIIAGIELAAALERERRTGRRIVFTNGCFDLLHAGHLHLLNYARSRGEVLVVGLNSDRSVRKLKGASRPVYHQADRAALIAALEIVDYVVIFDELCAEEVIREVRPDVLVKGGDWSTQEIDGQAFVLRYGGEISFAPLLEGHSTTSTIGRLRNTSTPRAESVESFDS
jgi:D-beta-D-heptose 7-phosphate kinase / D-beta-D-heptose 1-phosphate adenosyltransferase